MIEEKETYRKASWVMFAKEEGIGPVRLLLFSRLIKIQISIFKFFTPFSESI